MKKSKIIVPALAMIGLSAVASITGSVAWFTANRTATITAGEFAVVKTSANLIVALDDVAGVNDPEDGTSITVKNNYTLSDASFDHTYTSDGTIKPHVVTPNSAGLNVAKNSDYSTLDETELNRGGTVYSAIVWDISFSIQFTDSAAADQGLFLDLSNADTFMHKVVKFDNNATIPANVYSDAKCTTSVAGESAVGGKSYYMQEPTKSGKAFRIAFVPLQIPANSKGYAKIWAANDDSEETNHGKFVDGLSVGDTLSSTAYGTDTMSLSNTTYTAETLSAAKVFMTGSSETIPGDGLYTESQVLASNANYLGFFKAAANTLVTLKYRCIAWYEGTYTEAIYNETTLETMTASMKFGVCDLKAA